MVYAILFKVGLWFESDHYNICNCSNNRSVKCTEYSPSFIISFALLKDFSVKRASLLNSFFCIGRHLSYSCTYILSDRNSVYHLWIFRCSIVRLFHYECLQSHNSSYDKGKNKYWITSNSLVKAICRGGWGGKSSLCSY